MNSWQFTSLNDIYLNLSTSMEPQKTPDTCYELFSVPSYSTGHAETCLGSQIGSNKLYVSANVVLLCKINPRINRVWLVPSSKGLKQIASTEWIPFWPRNEIFPKYLAYFMNQNSFRDHLASNASGVGGSLMRIKAQTFSEYQFPICPLPEQRRIVAKIEELFSELDKGVELLKTLQQQLKIYRQAVLKAAFAGKLTEKVQSGNWPLVCLRDIAEYITDGDHQPPPKSISGIPFITISNIDQNNRIDFSQSFYVDKDYYHRLKNNRKPRKGDVLYTVTGSYGIPVLIDFDKEFCFQRHIGLIRPQKGISSKWLYYLLQSPAFYQQALRVSTGTAQKTIPLSGLRSIVVPFMTSKEQEVLVSEIESRLSVADIIEETIKQTLQQSEALRQSILKKAFEGRLLSAAELEELRKEPDWEPASVLLEKIKAQKAAADALKTPTKKSARKGKKQA